MSELLNYQRDRAIEWLGTKLKESPKASNLDTKLDELIRGVAKLPQGPLYGFVMPPRQRGKILIETVPFWHQLNNARQPHRTCFSSSCAMVLKHFLPDSVCSDDEYIETVFKFGDTTDPNAQVSALKSYGLNPIYRQDMGFEDLDRNLENGKPIAIGFLHRGPKTNPSGGHWGVVVGRSEDEKAYIVNDPYGAIPYNADVEWGQHVEYTKSGMLAYRWLVEGDHSGWGIEIKE